MMLSKCAAIGGRFAKNGRYLSTGMKSISFSDEKKERMKYMDSNYAVTNDKETKVSDAKRQELARLYISKNANRFGLRGNEKNKLLADNNWSLLDSYTKWDEYAIKHESERCLKCLDAPCRQGCPVSIDIKTFIYCLDNNNWYGAAKIILSDNPLGLSCAQLCDVNSLCKSVCILQNNSYTHNGIEIGKLQEYAVDKLKEMNIPQIRDPKWNHIEYNEDRICLIGYGSASISCATFLSRLGYKNIDIYEKEKDEYNFIGGGVLKSEIPKLRHNKEYIDWEMKQLLDINPNINIKYGEYVNLDNIDEIKSKFVDKLGYNAVFLGVGNQHINGPKTILSKIDGTSIFNSQIFLNAVNFENIETPSLKGHVLVLGIGDVALDCAVSAFRCGANQISVGFRRSFSDIRCSQALFNDAVMGEKCDILPNIEPLDVNIDEKTGKLQVVVMRTIGNYIGYNDEIFDDKIYEYDKLENEQYIIECDHLIIAFGQNLNSKEAIICDIINNNKNDDDYKWLFGGGDFLNQIHLNSSKQSVVNAVNDGKISSWNIHKYLRRNDIELIPNELPGYFTEIDNIDISVEMIGNESDKFDNAKIIFSNPFGLSSAPSTTSLSMIERAFDIGWSFAVTKTFCLNKDLVTNITPRIYNINDKKKTFANIELVSEKTAKYWCDGSKIIKQKYPNNIIIASIMAGMDLNDWSELIQLCHESDCFDAIELNLSCPHGMTDVGMGAFIGHSPELTKKVTSFCVEKSSLPIFVKETIETNEIDFLHSIIDSNAYGITAINTIPGINDCVEPNVLNTECIPYPNVGTNNLTAPGGLAGDALRPFSTKVIASINKYLFDNNIEKNINIMGCGGVNNGQNALHLIRFGSNTLQICSAVMQNDLNIIYDLKTGLKQNLYLNGYSNLQKNNIKGSLIKNIANIHDMNIAEIKIASINNDLCINCGKCYMSCNDSGYQAIDWDQNNRIPIIIEKDCSGCGLCKAVCPINNTINMIKKENNSIHYIDRGQYTEEIKTKW